MTPPLVRPEHRHKETQQLYLCIIIFFFVPSVLGMICMHVNIVNS